MPNKTFEDLKKIYEQSVDLEQISNEDKEILFLKVRSLTKKNLVELCNTKKLIKEGKKYGDWELRKLVFDNFTHKELNSFIENNTNPKFNKEEVKLLAEELKTVEEHAPAVFLDTFDAVLKRIVRDKKIMSFSVLREKIKGNLSPRLSSYVEWSWFNQKASDLIEDIFNEHKNIIPTLRKVKGVDFFIKVNDSGIPVDLKLTFLPKEFISIYTKDKKISSEEIIEMVKKNPKILADWLYENQNPRLFSNNKRFFIILIKNGKLEESWKLKAEYSLIKKEIHSFLDKIKEKDKIDVGYNYIKDEKVSGKYRTSCFLLIIEKD